MDQQTEVRTDADLWAWWPDDTMCPLDEVYTMTHMSDDYHVVKVIEYHETGDPKRWVIAN